MSEVFAALRSSHDRLAALSAGLSPDRVTGRAYPSEWSIAQVFSHLGSGAQIMMLAVDSALTGAPAPGRGANPPIWDRWNAKQPWAQVTDGVASDRGLVACFEALADQRRERLRIGSFLGEVTAEQLARLRLNEHALHTWDIAVALDPASTIGPEAVPLILDALGPTVGFAARGPLPDAVVRVQTTSPQRVLILSLRGRARLEPAAPQESSREAPQQGASREAQQGAPQGASREAPQGASREAPQGASREATPSLALPAEALIRLVYGRLDPAHTPPLTVTGIDLDDLRRAFPGF